VRRNRRQLAPQAILPESIKKRLVPAFASNHEPVLAQDLAFSQ
jgi:hypothetical protein